jgi:hypothetical protein
MSIIASGVLRLGVRALPYYPSPTGVERILHLLFIYLATRVRYRRKGFARAPQRAPAAIEAARNGVRASTARYGAA